MNNMEVPSPTSKVVRMDIEAPMPFLRVGAPADGFRRLRSIVIDEAGFDFLAKVGDMMRTRGFRSNKPGVARRSRHQCGDAFDVNQDDKRVVIVHEPQGVQSFFRVWLWCGSQDATMGKSVVLKDIRGHTVKGWYFDFTAAADRCGFKRIPAWRGWALSGAGYTKMEWWHYQLTEGLSWDEAMAFLYGGSTPARATVNDIRKPAFLRVLGLNDRGLAVSNIQTKLAALGFLDRNEIDGVFGVHTQMAVKAIQEKYHLDVDGLVGLRTRNLLDSLTRK